MQQVRALQIDDFFENPNQIRECALAQEFKPPTDDDVWLGLRSDVLDLNIGGVNVEEYIKNKIKYHLPNIPELEITMVFHLLPESVRGDMGNSFEYLQSHTDSEKVHFAGIVYLTPKSIRNSGTSFFADVNTKFGEIENEYNRFIFYPADIIHSATNPFGENKEDSRLTLTFFCSIKQ